MSDIQRLIEILKSDDPNKRYDACEELRVSPQPLPQDAIDALQGAMNDSNSDVANAARRAFELHTGTSKPIKLLEKQPSEPVVRRDLVGSIGIGLLVTKPKNIILIPSAILLIALNVALFNWNQSLKVLEVPYLADIPVNRVAFDKAGQVWVFGEGGLRAYKDGTLIQAFTEKDSPVLLECKGRGENILGLEVDNKGRVWIASQVTTTEAHLAFFDGTDWSTIEKFPTPLGEKPGIKSLAIDFQDRVWIGTASGLYIIDGESKERYTSQNSGLLGDSVTAISFDNQGRAWIASWGKTTQAGLNIFDGKDWLSLTEENTPQFDLRIETISFDSKGQAWIGADEIYVYDGENWSIYPGPGDIDDIVIDGAGRVWAIGYFGTIKVFDGKSWKVYRYSQGQTGCPATIATDEDGNVWIPTQAKGVTFIPSDKHKYLSPLENRISLAIASHGLIYLDIFLFGIWLYFAITAWRSTGLTVADLLGYLASKKETVMKALSLLRSKVREEIETKTLTDWEVVKLGIIVGLIPTVLVFVFFSIVLDVFYGLIFILVTLAPLAIPGGIVGGLTGYQLKKTRGATIVGAILVTILVSIIVFFYLVKFGSPFGVPQ